MNLSLTPLQEHIREYFKLFKVDLNATVDSRRLFNKLFQLLGFESVVTSVNHQYIVGSYDEFCLVDFNTFEKDRGVEISSSIMRYWVYQLEYQVKNKIEENLEELLDFPSKTDLLDLLLKGEKLQFRFNDKGQWSNVTDKVTIGTLKHPNCYLRLKPKTIEIDGKEFSPSDAISYIQRQYGVI